MSRKPPYVWKRFWSLPKGTDFFIGQHLYFKNGFCRACAAFASFTTLVAPWRKVCTTEISEEMKSQIIAMRDCGFGTGKSYHPIVAATRGRSVQRLSGGRQYGKTDEQDRRDAVILAALVACGIANTGKTEAYAEELRRRYPIKGVNTGRIKVRPDDREKLMNTAISHGCNQPHKDDERTGPSA